jgi:hypothetical protein
VRPGAGAGGKDRVAREETIRAAAREIFSRERLGELVLGGPFLALVFAGLWGLLSTYSADSWPVGMIFSGFAVGLTVRLLGRGARPIFYASSLVLYFTTIVFAIVLFDVMEQSFISTRLLIVVGGIGISAASGLVSFGFPREERWVLRDNRGFANPEEPSGTLGGMAAPMGALAGACVLAGLIGGFVVFLSPSSEPEELPIFGEPSVGWWEKELASDSELADEARQNGIGLGLDGSDEECHSAVKERHVDCELNLCKAQRPYVLRGCLETAKAVRRDKPIEW